MKKKTPIAKQCIKCGVHGAMFQVDAITVAVITVIAALFIISNKSINSLDHTLLAGKRECVYAKRIALVYLIFFKCERVPCKMKPGRTTYNEHKRYKWYSIWLLTALSCRSIVALHWAVQNQKRSKHLHVAHLVFVNHLIRVFWHATLRSG